DFGFITKYSDCIFFQSKVSTTLFTKKLVNYLKLKSNYSKKKIESWKNIIESLHDFRQDKNQLPKSEISMSTFGRMVGFFGPIEVPYKNDGFLHKMQRLY